MAQELLLGIDLGTSGTKTVLFDTKGKAITSKTVEYPMYQPQNGWAEQDASDWWNAVAQGISAVLQKSGADPSAIRGVGLSGQMHGLVMLDKAGEVLRRAIIWCDQRTSAEVAQINRVIGERRVIEITANPAMTGFTAAKILWVQNNEPEVYAKCAHILLPKDYIRYKLTGEFATEVSDAAGMQLMDVPARDWSGEVLTKLSIDRAMLGKMYESQDLTGKVHAAAAKETGLAVGTPVAGGAGDNPAAAVGAGIVRAGRAFTTIGSSAVVYAVSDQVTIDLGGRVHTLCASVPGKWTVMSCTQGAGLSLQWLRNTCCAPETERAAAENKDPYYIMDKLAADVPIGAGRLLYLPYLMGERSPHPDPDCRGVFFGLSAIHGRPELIRAVLEGVAYSQRECVDVFREMGVVIEDMLACGGGARSAIWRQMLADLYGCPVSLTEADEGPALGVALLAGVGAGVYASVEQACDAAVRKGSAQPPDMEAHAKYEPYFALYKKLYRDLKADFETLAKIE
ncbi:MAG: xylulokinase [Clostridiales bacterium]|jgi:xylulokinase|nr:xylulokinase [Clostridiales bacterium]